MGASVGRRWYSPNLRRWRNLMEDLRAINSKITQEEVQAWLDTEWLERATSPANAKLARIAFSENMTCKELSAKFGKTQGQYGIAARTAYDALLSLFRSVQRGEVAVVKPGEAYPTLSAPMSAAIVTGMAKSSYFRGVLDLLDMRFDRFAGSCSDEEGLLSSRLTMSMSTAGVKRLCKLCAEVHMLNGKPCAKCTKCCGKSCAFAVRENQLVASV